MVRNFIRTCDICHKEVSGEEYLQRSAGPDGVDLLVVLLENQEDFDFELSESPDGAIAFDTCRKCYARMTFSHSHALN
jgi:hypothetical protein